VALQLTNIVRDVGEDAARGRLYLPLEDLRRFGLEEADVLKGRNVHEDPRYQALIEFQIQRALCYYHRAGNGLTLMYRVEVGRCSSPGVRVSGAHPSHVPSGGVQVSTPGCTGVWCPPHTRGPFPMISVPSS
jgi:hypothetical protein